MAFYSAAVVDQVCQRFTAVAVLVVFTGVGGTIMASYGLAEYLFVGGDAAVLKLSIGCGMYVGALGVVGLFWMDPLLRDGHDR